MKLRKSNLELFRIICMFLIVCAHVTWEGDLSFVKSKMIYNTVLQLNWMFGQVGVIGFTLISAYFLSSKEEINIGKLSSVTNLTWIYTWLIFFGSTLFYI